MGQIPFPHATGNPKPHRRRSRSCRCQGSRKQWPRSADRDRWPRFPALDALHPGDDGGAGEGAPAQPLRSHQGLAESPVPAIEVGVMELNRYPENYFAEVEQAAFSPANIVPGIGLSPDKMLQARLFSYGDTQRYRLGINFNHIPVNAPKCPFL